MKRLFLLIGVLLTAAVITACGSDVTGAQTGGTQASDTSPAGEDHNAADVTFAQEMIAHHQQAVAMADLAATRAFSPQVKTLATQIHDAQAPEITTMTGWLRAWGQPAATPGTGHDMGGMSAMPMASSTPRSSTPMSSMPMARSTDGMMSEQDMKALEAGSGRKFDRMFLQMMITHHQGAVAMADTELRDGRYGPAKQLAASISTSQTAEITAMQNLLTTL
jgi:uncharacterized protein (DUF305 family)